MESNEKRKNPYWSVIVASIITGGFPIVLYIIFACMTKSFNLGLDEDMWVSLTGGFLAYAATCFMGLVALWQNVRQRLENEAAQEIQRQDNKEAQEELKAYNQKLLAVLREKDAPAIDILLSGIKIGEPYVVGGFYESEVGIDFVNIGRTTMRELNIYQFYIEINEDSQGGYMEDDETDSYIGQLAVGEKSHISLGFHYDERQLEVGDVIRIYVEVGYRDLFEHNYRKGVTLFVTVNEWTGVPEIYRRDTVDIKT